jgi:hypothetical protein
LSLRELKPVGRFSDFRLVDDSNVAPTRKGGVKAAMFVLVFKQSFTTYIGDREQSNVNQN